MEEKENGVVKRKMTVENAVTVLNVLKKVNISRLDKDVQFAVLRASRVLRPFVTGYEDFFKDAQQRLMPEDFDSVIAKRDKFDELPDDEKIRINKSIYDYDRKLNECLSPELNREIEVEYRDVKPFDDDALSAIASCSENLSVSALLLLQDYVG